MKATAWSPRRATWFPRSTAHRRHRPRVDAGDGARDQARRRAWRRRRAGAHAGLLQVADDDRGRSSVTTRRWPTRRRCRCFSTISRRSPASTCCRPPSRSWPRIRTSSASRNRAATWRRSPTSSPAPRRLHRAGRVERDLLRRALGRCGGGILALARLVPEACVAAVRIDAQGRGDEALALQQQLLPISRLVGSTYGVPGLKAALRIAGCDVGVPRPPLAPVSEAGMAALQRGARRFEKVAA